MTYKLTLVSRILLIVLASCTSRTSDIHKTLNDQSKDSIYRSLILMLDSIHETDQRFRKKLLSKKDSGNDPTSKTILTDSVKFFDSINTLKVTSILDQYGWLGPNKLGVEGNNTLFLVIQHSDLPTQEKYLPMLEDAVERGNAEPSALAMLKDKIAVKKGEPQVYGSQLMFDSLSNKYKVMPITDPKNVDKRRKEVGLMPIAIYLKLFDVSWDVNAHVDSVSN